MRRTRSEFFVLAIITRDSVALSTSLRMESGCSFIMADMLRRVVGREATKVGAVRLELRLDDQIRNMIILRTPTCGRRTSFSPAIAFLKKIVLAILTVYSV